MAGLVAKSMGEGVGQAMTNLGTLMFKSQGEEDRQQERLDLMREKMQQSAAEAAANRESREATERAKIGATGAGDITQGSLREEQAAAEMGVTVPEFRRVRGYVQTGDKSAYAQTSEVNATDDEAGDNTGEQYKIKVTDYPPGVDEYLSAKTKALAQIEKQSVYGKNLEGVEKGVGEGQKNTMRQGLIDGSADAGKVGMVSAAMEGKPLFDGNADVTRNNFTGATSTTEVGKSVVGKNAAGAAKERADAGDSSTRPERDLLASLREERLAAERVLVTEQNAMKELRSNLRTKPDDIKAQQDRIDRAGQNLAEISDSLRRMSDRAEKSITDKGQTNGSPQSNNTAVKKPSNPGAKNYSSLWK